MTLTIEQIAAKKNALLKSIGILSAVVFVVYLALAAYAYNRHGYIGVMTATLATAVCWGCSLAALCLTYKTAGTPDALSGVFGGIMLRTGIPMAFAVLGSNANRSLSDAGLMGMTLLMFLLSLAVETPLAVSIVSASQKNGANGQGSEAVSVPSTNQPVTIQD